LCFLLDDSDDDLIAVSNAGSRSKKQVEAELGKENVEFLTDIHGRIFVTLATDDLKFEIHKENSGMDDYLSAKNK